MILNDEYLTLYISERIPTIGIHDFMTNLITDAFKHDIVVFFRRFEFIKIRRNFYSFKNRNMHELVILL